ncbi:MAG: DNA polymerase III subunit delta [Lachnospiraceae bacterium]|nr:DNA polymerase III subunit delta [Lachnospiraceae bacterium]
MAAKKGTEASVNWVAEDLKNKELKNIYLLYGEEAFLKQQNMNWLLKYLMPEDDGMNFARFDGKKAEVEAIIDFADTMPLFADHRVVLVTDSGFFKNGNAELNDYIKHLPETTYLIFVEKEASGVTALFKTVKELGRVVAYNEMTEDEIRMQVLRILKREGKQMRGSTFSYLLMKTGTDMMNIASELEKLICYTLGREEITAEDIDAVTTARIEEHVFVLTNAIAEKKQKKALDSYYEMLSLNAKPMGIISLLAGQFNRMLRVKDLRSIGMDQKQIETKLKMKAFAVQENGRLASRFSMEELKEAIEDCVRAEEAIKTGRMSDRLSVETLIIKHSV